MSGDIDHLLDTNVVIGLLKGHAAALALAEAAGLAPGRFGVSQITRMELLGYPGLTDAEDEAVRRWLALCRVLTIDDKTEARAIGLRRRGLLRLPDAIVAATALAADAHLLTLDERLARVFGDEVRSA
ncbi:MAG: PIN domain-containing protein [Proteobacteria bacterium]|nr:PIN domain-containing protein [Pseudomonadota bacterium]